MRFLCILFIANVLAIIQSQVSPHYLAYSAPLAEGGAGLFILNINAPDDTRQIATCAYACEGIAWHTTENRIGYMDDERLIIRTLDGDIVAQASIQRGTYPYNVRPSWTPDLSQVVFDARYDARNWLVIVDMATGQNDITTIGGTRPVWLPDGRIGYNVGGSIRVYHPLQDAVITLTPTTDYHDSPAWSPDGAQVAFRVWIGGEDYALAVMNVDGTDGRVLMTGIVERPVWSPDGTQLATIQWNNLQGTRTTLYIIDVQTGNLTAFRPRVDVSGLSPVWVGDSAVAYVGRWMPFMDNVDIFLRDVTDGQPVRLVHGVGDARHPAQQLASR